MKVPGRVEKAFAAAVETRKNAYAPYSKFKVGAALITKSGRVYTGCNVENASYGGTVCAERTAIFKAVSEGETEFEQIVVTTDAKEPAFPCGFCLQVMTEFLAPDALVWIADTKKIRGSHKMSELIPNSFGPRELKNAKKSAMEKK